MEEQKKYENIEAWLAGDLTGKKLEDFETALRTDKQLAEEVEMHQNLSKLLTDSPKNRFRETLTDIRSENSQKKSSVFKNPWIWTAVGLIFFLLGGLYFSNQQNKLPGTSKEKTEINILEPTEKELLPAEKENNKSEPVEGTEPKQNQEKPSELIEKPASEKAPLKYADNFEINQLLEDEMNDMVRGSGTKFQLRLPGENAIYERHDSIVTISFSGSVSFSEELSDDFTARLMLFSNKTEDYQYGRALFETDVAFQKADDGQLRFSFEKKIDLAPGLYYFIFEDVNSEEYLKIGKIKVKK